MEVIMKKCIFALCLIGFCDYCVAKSEEKEHRLFEMSKTYEMSTGETEEKTREKNIRQISEERKAAEEADEKIGELKKELSEIIGKKLPGVINTINQKDLSQAEAVKHIDDVFSPEFKHDLRCRILNKYEDKPGIQSGKGACFIMAAETIVGYCNGIKNDETRKAVLIISIKMLCGIQYNSISPEEMLACIRSLRCDELIPLLAEYVELDRETDVAGFFKTIQKINSDAKCLQKIADNIVNNTWLNRYVLSTIFIAILPYLSDDGLRALCRNVELAEDKREEKAFVDFTIKTVEAMKKKQDEQSVKRNSTKDIDLDYDPFAPKISTNAIAIVKEELNKRILPCEKFGSRVD
jgi:hypothetical protein